MLFKQWNDFSEPRHEIDDPVILPNEESLQCLPLPVVEIPSDIKFEQYDEIIITTKVMNPLFSSKLLQSKVIGQLSTELLINKSLFVSNADDSTAPHSWNYNENFPNEFDPSLNDDETRASKKMIFKFPIIELSQQNTTLISIDENFLKFSPIFANIISKELFSQIPSTMKVTVIGASDKIYSEKLLSINNCTLQPPEFITGVVGSVIDTLIRNKYNNFTGIIVPSEGPTGFEKLSLPMMDELIDFIVNKWLSTKSTTDNRNYRDECHRNWRLDGAAMSTQSGLYI